MRCFLCGLTLSVAFTAADAHAVGEDERQIALTAGYARVTTDGRRPAGLAAGLEGQYGLSDTWSARLGLALSLHPVDEDALRPGGLVRAVSVVAGVTYAVDVLRLIPFVDLGFGLLDVGGDVASYRRDMGFELGVGAEYLLSPKWTLAALARYCYLPLQLRSVPPPFEQTPWRLLLALRLGWLF